MEEQELAKWFEDCAIINPEVIGDYFIGKYRVIFGYRLRAGRIGSGFCNIDLCCGDSEPAYNSAYRIYKAKMERNLEEGLHVFSDLPPITEVKPYFNDPEFVRWLPRMAEELG